MDNLDLPIGEKIPDIVAAVVGIPLDAANKYEYDKTLQVFRPDRNTHSPVHYPGDYDFIPQTLAKDGDPFDTLILGDAPTFPVCVFNARPVGLFEMLDQGIPDEKVPAYATGNPRFSSVQNYKQVQQHIFLEVEFFFSIYRSWDRLLRSFVGNQPIALYIAKIRSPREFFLALFDAPRCENSDNPCEFQRALHDFLSCARKARWISN